jgi:hypothetical protein
LTDTECESGTLPGIGPKGINCVPPRVDFDPDDHEDPDAGRQIMVPGRGLRVDDVIMIARNSLWLADRASAYAERWCNVVEGMRG